MTAAMRSVVCAVVYNSYGALCLQHRRQPRISEYAEEKRREEKRREEKRREEKRREEKRREEKRREKVNCTQR